MSIGFSEIIKKQICLFLTGIVMVTGGFFAGSEGGSCYGFVNSCSAAVHFVNSEAELGGRDLCTDQQLETTRTDTALQSLRNQKEKDFQSIFISLALETSASCAILNCLPVVCRSVDNSVFSLHHRVIRFIHQSDGKKSASL